MNEKAENYMLASVGILRGLYEEARTETTLERVEALGLVCALGGIVLAGYAINRTLKEIEN